MIEKSRLGPRAGASAALIALLSAGIGFAEEDVFDADAKPTFRKLAPESTGGDFYYSEDFEPDIVIRDEPSARIREFSVNGNTYMMKVEPNNAPPYFLVDTNGDGRYGWRRGGTADDIMVPGWAIASW